MVYLRPINSKHEIRAIWSHIELPISFEIEDVPGLVSWFSVILVE